ncbi:MAG TPA: hypothetical protein VHN14_29935 [Kofleriaceae bacterium]|jgi:hypothetical protein|nr:hypothetical protein [Kofleriaceae bacterium]
MIEIVDGAGSIERRWIQRSPEVSNRPQGADLDARRLEIEQDSAEAPLVAAADRGVADDREGGAAGRAGAPWRIQGHEPPTTPQTERVAAHAPLEALLDQT